MEGCSSHSGRPSLIPRAARNVSRAGGSRRDLQQLTGQANLSATQRYIEAAATPNVNWVYGAWIE